MDNHSYNLLKGMTKKAQAVTKYDTYLQDAGACAECQALWQKLKQEDQAHLEEMKRVLANRVQAGTLK